MYNKNRSIITNKEGRQLKRPCVCRTPTICSVNNHAPDVFGLQSGSGRCLYGLSAWDHDTRLSGSGSSRPLSTAIGCLCYCIPIGRVWYTMVHVPLMFLSEWREFPSAPCLAEKKNVMTSHVSMLLKSRASPDMFPFSLCNKKRLSIPHINRPLFPTTLSIPSYDIGK